ncbi:uncharacterized protein LOC112557008 isoform X1 [Pomacea canaliculata]|uniref:uncharacterized protein LOC112557008 isoform X1 n=1 Tax=Pomacea canaliculata TaxID=400727 RepID=UPI000D725D5A|nr:uncharacterized protein LOC112557008 isoform X1 [Pomacea canaliculata]
MERSQLISMIPHFRTKSKTNTGMMMAPTVLMQPKVWSTIVEKPCKHHGSAYSRPNLHRQHPRIYACKKHSVQLVTLKHHIFHDSHLITKDRLSGFAEKRRRDTFDERETARAAKEKRTELINDSIGSRLTLENKKIDMELELMEVKLQAARKQHEMEVELLKIKTECSRLKHMKLYYEVRKLEKELGVPGETGVNTLTSTIPVIDALEVNQTHKVYS